MFSLKGDVSHQRRYLLRSCDDLVCRVPSQNEISPIHLQLLQRVRAQHLCIYSPPAPTRSGTCASLSRSSSQNETEQIAHWSHQALRIGVRGVCRHRCNGFNQHASAQRCCSARDEEVSRMRQEILLDQDDREL